MEVITDDAFAYANPIDMQTYIKTELEIRIENILQIGKQNAIKMRDLKLKLGISNRKIRLTINSMRLKKILVISSPKGYWISESYEDYEEWARYMYSYIGDLSHVVKVMGDGALDKYKKSFQIPLFLKEK